MPHPLLPATRPLPIWRREGIRALEARLQALAATPLMDQAGLATARLALAVAPHARRIWVTAGPGNNGGDGLEAAMHLHRWGLDVQVSLLGDGPALAADARRALARARAAGTCITQGLPSAPPELGPQDLCIDALLGIGGTREPQGPLLQAIEWINGSPAQVLAIDVPTGLDADSGQVMGGAPTPRLVVHADVTLTFLTAKPGLFMGHGRDVCGDIWLDALTSACPENRPLPLADAWLNMPTPPVSRKHASHKGAHGDVAIIGGEPMHLHGMGMTGAAVLAAQAALHGGAGRVILSLLGASGENSAVPPDVMQRQFDQLDLSQLTVVAGCGGGQAIKTVLGDILRNSARLVLDADGLNAVAQNADWRALLRQRGDTPGQRPTVITPHPLEAGRLLGCSTQDVQRDRLQAAQTLSEQLQCTVILKGSGSVIASPAQVPCINTSGNGRLGIGGTGDVLAGLTGSLMAQGRPAHAAACAAAWQHGSAADHWPHDEALTASRLACRLY